MIYYVYLEEIMTFGKISSVEDPLNNEIIVVAGFGDKFLLILKFYILNVIYQLVS